MRQNHLAVQDGKSPSQARATILVTAVIRIVAMAADEKPVAAVDFVIH
jgi:hypothetical protein